MIEHLVCKQLLFQQSVFLTDITVHK